MPIVQGATSSFKLDLVQAVHNFATDTFRVALYRSVADIGPNTTAYTSAGEVTGPAYTAGGQVLTGVSANLSGRTVHISFNNPVWPGVAITARGAMIYNASKANRSVAILDFGADITRANFTINFPPNTATSAVIRIP